MRETDSPRLVDDADVHYEAGTRPQGRLPFSIRVRRKYRWWPGPERHGQLVDRLLLALALALAGAGASIWFGWLPVLVALAEIIIIGEIIYRVATGTMLGE